jgi:hypothetical protein
MKEIKVEIHSLILSEECSHHIWVGAQKEKSHQYYRKKKNIRILESSIFSENKKIKIILTFSCKSPTTPPLKKEKETIGGTSLGPHDMDDDG